MCEKEEPVVRERRVEWHLFVKAALLVCYLVVRGVPNLNFRSFTFSMLAVMLINNPTVAR